MARIQMIICALLCVPAYSLIGGPAQSPFNGGSLQINTKQRTRQDVIEEKQEAMEGDMTNVNTTINDMMARIEELEKRKDVSGSSSVTQVNQQVETIVSNQNQVASELSFLTNSVSKIEKDMLKVNQLQQQVGSLAIASNDLTSQVSALKTTVNNVKGDIQEVAELKTQVGSLTSANRETKAKLSSVSEDITGIEENRQEMGKLKQQMGSISSLPETVDKMKEDLKEVSQIKEQVASLSRANKDATSQLAIMSKAVGTVEETDKEVDLLKERVGSVAEASTKMSSQLSSLSKSVGNVEENTKKVSQLKEQVDSLTPLPAAVNKVQKDLKEVDQLKQQVGALDKANKDVASQLSSLSKSVSNVEKQVKEVGGLRKQMDSYASSQSRSNAELSSLAKDVGKFEQKVMKVGDMEDDIAELKTGRKETEKRITSVNDTLNKVEHALSHVKIVPTTCAEVKQCAGDKTDGEYWIYPTLLKGVRVKIYCSGLKTASPAEYVTLHYPNNGEYPGVQSYSCNGESSSSKPSLTGFVSFKKIRVNITTMEIVRGDVTFADTKKRRLSYGSAGDCYRALSTDASKNRCGPKGYFNIDTRKTGLRVDSQLTWKKSGYRAAAFVDRKDDGQIINIKCGGYCGGCYPDGGKIKLEIAPNKANFDNETTVNEPFSGKFLGFSHPDTILDTNWKLTQSWLQKNRV